MRIAAIEYLNFKFGSSAAGMCGADFYQTEMKRLERLHKKDPVRFREEVEWNEDRLPDEVLTRIYRAMCRKHKTETNTQAVMDDVAIMLELWHDSRLQYEAEIEHLEQVYGISRTH